MTGNKVAVAWRPAKRQKQELFGQGVGFWGDGKDGKCGDDADSGGNHADERVRPGCSCCIQSRSLICFLDERNVGCTEITSFFFLIGHYSPSLLLRT